MQVTTFSVIMSYCRRLPV